MPWLQLEIETSPQMADMYSEYLSQAGASAVTLQDAADQPLFEPAVGETPLWRNTRVIGLFDVATDIDNVMHQIKSHLDPNDIPSLYVNPLEDRDWVRAWMDNFKPMQFGKQLWVCPSGYTPPDAKAVNLILDPGLAFGTGTHPTTAMCLSWLANHPPKNLEVMDYGCGSGVLAIAACLLGAKNTMAVDNDPQALTATHENAIKNSVANKIETYLPEQLPTKPVPLLMANILATPLIELESLFEKLVISGGTIVLSGILVEQASLVQKSYATHFNLQIHEQLEDWVCITGRKH